MAEPTESKLLRLCVFAGTNDSEALKLLADGELAKLCLLCENRYPGRKIEDCVVAVDASYFHCNHCNFDFAYKAERCPRCGNSEDLKRVFNSGC